MNAKSDNHDKGPRGQAVEWFVTLQSGEVARAQQEAFADWLRRSPVHIEEFLQLTALYGELARLPELKAMGVPELLTEAASHPMPEPTVIGLGLREGMGGERPVGTGKERLAWSRATRAVAGRGHAWRAGSYVGAAAASLLVVLVIVRISGHNAEHYNTAVAEQRSLTLSDGSHVQLNVQSNLSAQVTEGLRDLRLSEGEALFEVAKDAGRPFRVHTPQATIEAIGTQFDVQVRDGLTEVTLLEGQVRVQSADASPAVTLEPGQKITISAARGGQPPAPQRADLGAATAWTRHRLVFEDTPLSAVIAEFNRYSRQQLVIRDAQLRDKRITASFDAGDPQTFSASLAAAAGTRVSRQSDGTWLIEPAGGAH